MGITRNSLKLLLLSFTVLIFSSCTRTSALTSSIVSDTLKPAEAEAITASSAPHSGLSVAAPNPTYLAEQPAKKPSLIKSVKEVYKLKKTLKSNSVIPKSEKVKARKNYDPVIDTLKIVLGVILCILGTIGLLYSLLFLLFLGLSDSTGGNSGMGILLAFVVLCIASIVGGVLLIVNAARH